MIDTKINLNGSWIISERKQQIPAFRRMMPNIEGSRYSRGVLVAGLVRSTLHISVEAAGFIAGMIPVDILASEVGTLSVREKENETI